MKFKRESEDSELSKRIHTFDFIRNVTTLMMVFVHLFFAAAEGSESETIVPGMKQPTFFEQIGTVYGTWVSIFFFIPAGVVNAYAFSKKLKSGKNTLKQLTISELIKCLYYYPFHFTTFLRHERMGLIILFLRGKTLVWGRELIEKGIIYNDSYVLFSFYFLFLAVLFLLLFRKDTIYAYRLFHYVFFLCLGNLILFVTPTVCCYLMKIIDNWENNGEYGKALMLAPLGESFSPQFPFFGHACIGTFFGLVLALEMNTWILFPTLASISVVWIGIGIRGLLNEFDGIIYAGLISEKSIRGIRFLSYLRYVQFGGGVLIILCLYYFIDFVKSNKLRKFVNFCNISVFCNVGNISMSIYCVESFAKYLYHFLFEFIVPGWEKDKTFCVLLGFPFVLMWIWVAKVWARVHYRYSFEWFLAKLIEQVTGKKSYVYK